jgi:large subunit ribosomal protein L5
MSEAYEPRLKRKYREEIRAKLQEQFNYSNPMKVPKLDKVVINMGVGEATSDSKKIKSALAELERIAGQKPVAAAPRPDVRVP